MARPLNIKESDLPQDIRAITPDKKITASDMQEVLDSVYDFVSQIGIEVAGGATLDFSNYAQAATRMIEQDEDYDTALEIVRANREKFAQEYPKAAFLANLAGSIATTGGLASLYTKAGLKVAKSITRIMKGAEAAQKTKKLGGMAKFAGMTGIGMGEAAVSEVFRKGLDKAEPGKAAAIAGAFGALPAGFMARADKAKANYWAARAMGPLDGFDDEGVQELGATLLQKGIVKATRSQKEMKQILKGTLRLNPAFEYDADLYKWLDATDVIDEGLIAKESKKIDEFIDLVDKHYKSNRDISPSDWKAKDPVGGGSIGDLKAEMQKPIETADLVKEIKDELGIDLMNKNIVFLDRNKPKAILETLDNFVKHHGALDVGEAHRLKKALGKELRDKAWAESIHTNPGRVEAAKRLYIKLKNEIEAAATDAARLESNPIDWGEAIQKTNRGLGSLMAASKLLDETMSNADKRHFLEDYGDFFGGTAVAGALGGLTGSTFLGAVGFPFGVMGKRALQEKGPGALSRGHQIFDRPTLGYQTTAGIGMGAERLFGESENSAYVQEVPSIQRNYNGAVDNMALFQNYLNTNNPELSKEFRNAIASGDKETVAQIIADISPQMEEFMVPSPVKTKGVRIKSAIESPRIEGAYKIGNPMERDILASDIMEDEAMSEAEKYEMIQSLNKDGVLKRLPMPVDNKPVTTEDLEWKRSLRNR